MTLTRLSLGNPVAVAVGVLMAILFGAISLSRLPVQLTPEVEQPEITITTQWRAAAPQEVESEIVEPQEKVLRGLPGMTKLTGRAQRGQGQLTITFDVGMNLERGLLEILNRLNRVPSYPDDADEPVISTIGGDSRPIAWFIVKALPGNDRDIASYADFAEEVIQTRFERIPGVALSEVRGGRERELRITFDPFKAAALGVELPKAAALAGGAKDSSAGFVEVGKRRYTMRFAGRYSPEALRDMILDWRDGLPVRLRDVATVEVQLKDRSGFVIQNGAAAIAVNAHRETGVNVLSVMAELKKATEELREGPLARANLSITQVYDETIYIDRSIAMVRNNLAVGLLLAVGILWWFLRRLRATLIVALAIPVSLFTTFIFLDVSGRTLNVISLAGMAFAAGMVLDAAIVVLENIVRLREKGESDHDAAIKGAGQVWGALLASTATTVAIFLPVLFMADEAGQLFADLALAVAGAVSVSLLVAVTVLPAAAAQWLKNQTLSDPHSGLWNGVSSAIMTLTATRLRRALWITVLLTLPAALIWQFAPKPDYLPQGNRNLVFAFIMPPPGTNIDYIASEMGDVIAQRMQPYIDGEKAPHVNDYFFVAFSRGVFMGARTKDPAQTQQLVPLINSVVRGFPDTLAFAKRSSLFGGFGSGNTIDVDLQGRSIESLLQAAQAGFGTIRRILPGASVRPFPGLDLADPELRLTPIERSVAEAGWDRSTLTGIIRALGDGLFVGDYFDGEQRLDIILRAAPWSTPEALANLPLATPDAGVLPLNALVDITRTAGPEEIRRIDRRRTITLQVTPPEGMALEDAVRIIREKAEPVMADLMPEDGDIRYAGSANKLEVAKASMLGNFILAIVILYLLMSALFRSFLDSLLVVLAIPLATVGGVLALLVINLMGIFQPMDLLTMIGFIILLGLVVNNAILLVHQTRTAEREGLCRADAVEQAVRMRLRPILMSTLTSIFGMLPLLLMPGAGSELYRGLAAVIVGGMAVSTVFTLLLLPSLLRIGEGAPQAEGTLLPTPRLRSAAD